MGGGGGARVAGLKSNIFGLVAKISYSIYMGVNSAASLKSLMDQDS